jgi:polysaccharide export outer membrane protein
MTIKHLRTGFFIIILFCCSCTTYKNVPYFQDLKPDSVFNEKITNLQSTIIQPGDLLAFHVTSLDHEADAPFNYNLLRPENNIGNDLDVTQQNTVYGYLVNDSGAISLPSIGSVQVAGLTIPDCAALLESKLSDLLKQPNVNVRIANFKVSVLGDVKSPGTFNIVNGKISLTQAISLAGDLNTTGIRNNVLLIREYNGVRQYIRFDLTSKNTFISPYYYLKNNDVIYVQPNKEKVNNDSNTFQKTSIVLTVISILAILFSKNL